MSESALLHFAQHRLQEAALLCMAVVYAFRIRWLLSFKDARDKQAPTGRGVVDPESGKYYSLANIAMPWAMESTRNSPFFYLQFAVFHLGVACAITLSFIIPYLPGLLELPPVVKAIQGFTAAAFVIGVGRMIRRIAVPVMRLISTPDDYFSLALLTVWFPFAFLAAPNDRGGGEGVLLTFFFLTAFFLVYVPFSKISHYLYYPFTRFWLGRTMGHRGVFPMRQPVHPR
ncbi:MAG: hypothetical protein HY748_06060 [Elusimicrobia bacterium]|nr:hypothetical protein [Elusimicrobiota bacterium]